MAEVIPVCGTSNDTLQNLGAGFIQGRVIFFSLIEVRFFEFFLRAGCVGEDTVFTKL